MGRRRSARNRSLPANLYARGEYFSWRDPRDGKEYGLGKDRRSAIEQALEANLLITSQYSAHRLVDRLTGAANRTFADWHDRYIAILEKRGIKPNSIVSAKDQLRRALQKWGNQPVESLVALDIADLLKEWTDAKKERMATMVRGRLADFFREAIAAGWISANPADVTKVHGLRTKRERLSLESFLLILKEAEKDKRRPWAASSLKLALLSGQRREDIACWRPSDVRDNFLWVDQEKTGMKLKLPLSLRLEALPQSLGEVISECLNSGVTNPETIVHARQFAHRVHPGKALRPALLTRAFADARDQAGIGGENPPTLHEIRSLSGRLYEEKYGERFAQRILGHRNAQTTALYLDTRGSEWMSIEPPQESGLCSV
ncbi:tyrosine-type recombinase/integrase [Chromobacterium vaccinii]|uniref:tyrosine-type recombinase/integrase n=1 Tax=Chromobacterium vaccinii TaxID=1108595 RepID=UPI003C755E21